jgi:hypothetical protein
MEKRPMPMAAFGHMDSTVRECTEY